MATQSRNIIFNAAAVGGPVLTRGGTVLTPSPTGQITTPTASAGLGTDIDDAMRLGIVAYPQPYIGKLIGANMNSTADQGIQLYVPATASIRLTKISILNASVSLTTAAGGFYAAASKGGTAIVASTQVYSALTTSLLAVDATLAATGRVYLASGWPLVGGIYTMYFSLTTGQGAAATADIYVFGDVYE